MAPRWVKVWRDARAGAGRMLTIVAALATGTSGVVLMQSTYAVLHREVPRNYIASRPASAHLTLRDSVPSDVLVALSRVRGVTHVSRAARVSGRIRVGTGDTWLPLLLFVVPSWRAEAVNMVRIEGGAWPDRHGLLVERSALALTGQKVGGALTLDLGRRGEHVVPLTGTVHDPGVAPAWQEQVVYGYADEPTLRALGIQVPLDILKVVAADWRSDAAILALVDSARAITTAAGGRVAAVQVPPPGRHPHQSQMNAVITMLLAFSVMALLLAAVLTATVIDGLLAQQVRQVAIMKAIGARTSQVASLYIAVVACLGVIAVCAGMPLGFVAGRAMITVTAQLLNLEIASYAVPWWVYATALVLGVGAPLVAALVPIGAAARATVREGLDHTGTSGVIASRRRGGALSRLPRGLPPAASLALRNLARQPARALFAVVLLGMAGAMCITSLNLRSAWNDTVRAAAASRRYSLEVRLERPALHDSVIAAVRSVPIVTAVEAWSMAGAAPAARGGVTLSRSYPDGGHGALELRAAPADTRLVTHAMRSGGWLAASDTAGVVLNTMASAQAFPARLPGAALTLRIGEQDVTLRLAGIVQEHLTPAAAYVLPGTFERITGTSGRVNAVRVAVQPGTDDDAASARLTAALQQRGVAVRQVWSEGRVGAAQGGHVRILVVALALIAAIMSIVGLLGLLSALGVAVVARTRELGVLRAVGARDGTMISMVVAEGVLIAAASWLASLPAAAVLSRAVGGVLARISAQQLDLRLSPAAAAAWLGAVLVAATLTSLWPARRAARLTVRQALAFT